MKTTKTMSEELYYLSIDDMPLYNWRKCQEKEEFNYCRKNLKLGTVKNDLEAWEKIYDSYIAEFGLGKEYKRILELRLEIANLQCDFVISGTNFIRNQIKRLERELQEIMEMPVESDTDTILNHLRKWIGSWLNQREITVRDFYKLLRDYQNEIKSLKRA